MDTGYIDGELRGTLHERGLRMTPQRQMVLDAVRNLGHATPDEVCTEVQREAPAVNISTVYRTLDLLEQIGVLRHTHLGHGAPTYSADAHPHVHLVCHRCDGLTELHPSVLGAAGPGRARQPRVRPRPGAPGVVRRVCATCSTDGTDG